MLKVYQHHVFVSNINNATKLELTMQVSCDSSVLHLLIVTHHHRNHCVVEIRMTRIGDNSSLEISAYPRVLLSNAIVDDLRLVQR
jgi:hypothetical protein